MSREAETCVWKRSRAKGSNLLVLLKIADYADDEGKNAWPSAKTLARAARLTDRNVRYVLHKLEADGEIAIDTNTEGRCIEIRGRRIQPDWFISIRCIGEWETYQQEAVKPEKFSGSVFKAGRRRKVDPSGPPPPAKSEKFSGFAGVREEEETGKDFRATGSRFPRNRKSSVSDSILQDPLGDPLGERAAAPRSLSASDHGPANRAAAAPPSDDQKPAHEDPVTALVELYNAICRTLPPCLGLTPDRRKAVRGALTWRQLDDWAEVFEIAAFSTHCNGHNADGWMCTLDWLIKKPDNALRVLEGHFGGVLRNVRRAGPGAVDTAAADERRRLVAERNALPAHLHRVIARLRADREDVFVAELLDELDELCARASSLTKDECRDVAARLAILDARLLERASETLDDDAMAAIRQDADQELADFKTSMAADVFAASRNAAIERLMRERLKLPTLTWDYHAPAGAGEAA